QNFNTIDNLTAGEMLNVEASSIGNFNAQHIGVARSKTKAEIGGLSVRNNTFPFNDQRTLINVTGDVQAIRARGAIGNINVTGTIGDLAANTDRLNDKSIIEGIVGPVVTT